MSATLNNAVTKCPGCGRDVLLKLDVCPHCGGAADTVSAFVSYRYPGGGGGMVDQQTAAFLRSNLADPDPADLDQLLGRSARVRVSELVFRDRLGRFEPLFEVNSPEVLAGLRAALRVRPGAFGHLMMAPTHQVECFVGEQALATVQLVGVRVVRWPNRWRSDAVLADADAVADFFLAQGIPQVREELDREREEAARREAEHAIWSRSWQRAAPPGLLELAAELEHDHYAPDSPDSPARDRALKILSAEHPAATSQVLALLGWYGHALGPWSGYPSVESAPESLLETFPQEAVVAAVREPGLTVQQKEGAARFFCRWVHPSRRPRKPPKLPDDVRRCLWEHVNSGGDRNKIQRAARVLGG